MNQLWCILAMVLYQAIQIAYGGEYLYFPNFRSVDHGRGATSYQNVEINNGANIQQLRNYKIHASAALERGSEHYGHHDTIIPTADDYSHISDSAETVPYTAVAINQFDLKPEAILPHYEYDEHEQDYKYRL